jgi:hypothetical protein
VIFSGHFPVLVMFKTGTSLLTVFLPAVDGSLLCLHLFSQLLGNNAGLSSSLFTQYLLVLLFKMPKRPMMSSEDCGNMKRKKLSLSIKQKVRLLMKIQNPENPKSLSSQALQITGLVLYTENSSRHISATVI